MRTHKYCPHCYHEMKKSSLKELGYTFDCLRCEEDFFRFEVFFAQALVPVTFYGNRFDAQYRGWSGRNGV